MQIANQTPFKAMAVPGYDKECREIVTVVVKGTFRLAGGRRVEVAEPEEQADIVMADEYHGEPGASPVKCESDLAPFKPATDLILVGFAYPPRPKAARRMDVLFGVGKTVKKSKATSDKAVKRIPLHEMEQVPDSSRWLAAKKPRDGFGFYPKQYSPRKDLAGTYDDAWQAKRSPFLPADFDDRFFQAAFPDLICPGHLVGNEPLRAEGVSPRGPIGLKLPGVALQIEAFLERGNLKGKANLDTVVLDPENDRLLLTWRRMFPVNGPPADVQGFRISEIPCR
jgi:hypothetical protein